MIRFSADVTPLPSAGLIGIRHQNVHGLRHRPHKRPNKHRHECSAAPQGAFRVRPQCLLLRCAGGQQPKQHQRYRRNLAVSVETSGGGMKAGGCVCVCVCLSVYLNSEISTGCWGCLTGATCFKHGSFIGALVRSLDGIRVRDITPWICPADTCVFPPASTRSNVVSARGRGQQCRQATVRVLSTTPFLTGKKGETYSCRPKAGGEENSVLSNVPKPHGYL